MQEILKDLQDFLHGPEKNQCDVSTDNKSCDPVVSEAAADPPSKRAKLETDLSDDGQAAAAAAAAAAIITETHCVCVVCLGVLQEFSDTDQAVKVCLNATPIYLCYYRFQFQPDYRHSRKYR